MMSQDFRLRVKLYNCGAAPTLDVTTLPSKALPFKSTLLQMYINNTHIMNTAQCTATTALSSSEYLWKEIHTESFYLVQGWPRPCPCFLNVLLEFKSLNAKRVIYIHFLSITILVIFGCGPKTVPGIMV